MKSYDKDAFRKIKTILADVKANSVVDFGCWNGETTLYIADIVKAKRIIGVDGSAKALVRKDPRMTKIVHDFDTGEAPVKGVFDLIVLSSILEHVQDPDALLKTAKAHAKPDSLFLIRIPNLTAWYNRVSIMLGWQPFHLDASCKFKGCNPLFNTHLYYGHVRSFVPCSFEAILKRHGLVVIKKSGIKLTFKSLWKSALQNAFSLTPNLHSDLLYLCVQKKKRGK